MATLNVWFSDQHFHERCAATLALLESLEPDVITLQEVTPAFLKHVLEAPWIRAAYRSSDIRGKSVTPYGVLLLTRLPVVDWSFFPLPSIMGRRLLTARAAINGTTTTFATVHLESLSQSAPTRAEQLARIFPILAPQPHAILTGDFNLCSSWSENRLLDPAYRDVWPLLRGDDPGFTEDTERNAMRLRHTGKWKQVRFDRMLLRSGEPGWRAESIQLIGTDPIDPARPDVFPSDHFGLLGRFAWRP